MGNVSDSSAQQDGGRVWEGGSFVRWAHVRSLMCTFKRADGEKWIPREHVVGQGEAGG